MFSIERFLFPAPNPPHYTLTSHKEHLLWIKSKENLPIPCMLHSPSNQAQLFIIWCHGNGCDIGTMDMTLTALSEGLKSHILIFEYPSYGLLKGTSLLPNEKSINDYAECAYSFVRETIKWPSDRIIIYGHSIGSGPACHLASTKQIGGLILQSPYTSITNLIQEKFSIFSTVSHILKTSFWNNYEAIKFIKYPILFIHGEQDNIIPSIHSQILFDSIKHENKNNKFILLKNDDHNSIRDSIILMNLKPFIQQCFPSTEIQMPEINIDPSLHEAPILNKNSSKSNIFSNLFADLTSAFDSIRQNSNEDEK